MTFKQLFIGHEGRIDRLTYLGASLLLGLVMGAGYAALLWLLERAGEAGAFLVGAAYAALVAAHLWGAGMLVAKRLHDLAIGGIHALWVLAAALALGAAPVAPYLALAAAPIVAVACLVLLLVPGQRGTNAFGPQPGTQAIELAEVR